MVLSGSALTPFQNVTISYPSPTILNGTLRRGNENYTNPLTATANTGEVLSFNGTNFGIDSTKVAVYYGPASNLTLYVCKVVTLTDTYVSCVTGYGEGRQLVFSIIVGGVQATGTDVYQYPTTPQIYSVSGCDNTSTNPNVTINCHTAGGQTITIIGDALTSPLSLFVGGEECKYPTLTNGSSVTCDLPPGTGVNRPVVAYQGAFISKPAYAVSYAPPMVLGVQGCDSSTEQPAISGCPLSGGVTLTIYGSEFGIAGATAFVGGTACNGVAHDFSTPTAKLTCNLPAQQGKDLPVTIYQLQGELSGTTNVTVSYQPCPPGTHYDALSCILCDAGFYNDLPDRPACLPCPAGRFSDQTNTTDCTPIPAGFKSIPGNTTWYEPCDAGYFSTEGAAECSYCFPGFYQNGTGASFCFECDPGRFSDNITESNCTFCPGGKYALRAKASECLGCLSGQYSLQGSSICVDCWAGSFSDVNSSACSVCPNGTYSPTNRSQSCTTAQAGYYALANSSSQIKCSDGYWSTMNASFCTLCPNQTYSNGTACLPVDKGFEAVNGVQTACPSGTFSSGPGGCQPCPVGTYQNFTQGTTCNECPNNFWNNATGSILCDPCPNGTQRTSGLVCVFCPVGTSSTDGFGCSNCPAGTFSGGVQTNYSCRPCAVGKYSDHNASVSCATCPSGQTTRGTNQVGCIYLYEVSQDARATFIALAALGLAAVLATAIIFMVVMRKHPIVHRSGKYFSPFILVGFAFLYIAIILWVLEPSVAVCTAKHWFLNLGYTMIIITLLVKTWYLDKVFNNKKLAVVKTSNVTMIGFISGVIGVDLLILIIWAGAAPMTVDPYSKSCESNGIPAVIIVQWVLHTIYGILLLVATFRVRNIDKRFRDTYWVAAGLYNTAVACFALLVVSLATDLTPPSWLVFFVSILLYLTTSLFFFVFYPKFVAMYYHDNDFMKSVGLDIDRDISDAKTLVSSTQLDSSTASITGSPRGKSVAKKDQTEMEATKQQFEKVKIGLEKHLRKLEKEKEDMKKEAQQINVLKEDLIHLNERIEFLAKHPDQANAPANNNNNSMADATTDIPLRPMSPTAEESGKATEDLVSGHDRSSTSVEP